MTSWQRTLFSDHRLWISRATECAKWCRATVASLDVAGAETDACQIASQSQFSGVQFASVMLVGLFVRVERCPADATVHVSTTFNELDFTSLLSLVILLPRLHCRLVFIRLALHKQHLAVTSMSVLHFIILDRSYNSWLSKFGKYVYWNIYILHCCTV